jgi:tetratricopeptide (TPR) repeat protein
MLYFARQYREASDHLEKVLDLDPSYPPAPWFLGLTYLQQGKQEDAVRQLERAVTLSGRDVGYLSVLGWMYGQMGRQADADQILDELRESGRRGYLSPWNIALVYAGMNELDQAFAWLDKAFEERVGWMVFLPTFPLLDTLRADPRFHALLGRMNLGL